MPFRTGDIDELYEWSDDDRSDYSERPEEKRVGTQASFEELLERELAKEREQNGRSGGAAPAKPRKQFLKKGARGWWMEKATAKQKMHKHVLESVVWDDGDNNNQLGHNRKTAAKATVSPPTKGRRPSPPASSAGTVSPEPARREDVAPVQISPVRLTPTPRASMEGPRRSLPMWASAHANRRTDESIETLNMSRVRQDFENRREREADELADFEALEQELAAEKESYLREKHEIEENQIGPTSKAHYDDDDEASWLRDSADGASLRGETQHLLSGAAAFRSSYSDLDLGGDSAMVFDDDRVFRSPMPRASSVRDSSQRPRHSRPSFVPSEISAVSLNDSEPWGDANALDHFSNLPESPISRHGMASALLHGNFTEGYGSNRRDSLSSRRGANRRFGDRDLMEEPPSYDEDFHKMDEEDSTERGHSTSRPGTSSHDAPVSALVQQVFCGATESEKVWDADGYQPSRQHSRTDNERGVGGGSNMKPSPRPLRPAQGRKVSRQSIARDQRGGEEKLEQPSRRHAPGVLPVSIEEKLAKLEEETKLYKSETLQLQRKKAQYDEEIQRLARDKEDMGQYQDKQRQLIEQEWQQHRRKMKQEERNFERQMKLKLSAAGSRKDRAQIEALNAKIAVLKSEAEQSSAKMKATNDVLRQRIAELEGRNRELSEEVKFLERDRLDQWQKYEDLLKEVNTRKLNKLEEGRDQFKTLGDISRVSRSAEDLLGSLQFSKAEAFQSRTPTSSRSAASTPMNSNGGEYNPGRYRQADIDRVKPAESSQSSGKHSQEDDTNNGRFGSVIDDAGVDEVVHPGGKREITYRDGTKRIFFADGNEKEILPNGDVVIRFTNGDRKEYFPSTGVSVYHYHEAQTKLTTYPDKTKVYEFPNQQIEKSYPDGTTEIQFADGILKTIHPSGDEFSKFPDGTTMLETKDGLRDVTLLNGKKVRYYPDGSMTLVNLDGQESEVRSDEELRDLMETS